MDNINTDYFFFDNNIESDTELNTEIEIVTKKTKEIEIIKPEKKDKLLIRVKSDNIPYIFSKVKDLYNYIKINSIKKNEYYLFTLIKNAQQIIICMRTEKQILNYILTYHVEYDIIE